jgi:hypothetical protein
MADAHRLDAMDRFISDPMLGGARTGSHGYFYEPTMIPPANQRREQVASASCKTSVSGTDVDHALTIIA